MFFPLYIPTFCSFLWYKDSIPPCTPCGFVYSCLVGKPPRTDLSLCLTLLVHLLLAVMANRQTWNESL